MPHFPPRHFDPAFSSEAFSTIAIETVPHFPFPSSHRQCRPPVSACVSRPLVLYSGSTLSKNAKCDADLVESEALSGYDHITVSCRVGAVDLRPVITPDAVFEVVSQSHWQRLGRNTELTRVPSVTTSTHHTAQPAFLSRVVATLCKFQSFKSFLLRISVLSCILFYYFFIDF